MEFLIVKKVVSRCALLVDSKRKIAYVVHYALDVAGDNHYMSSVRRITAIC